jgi:hypothetical protein
MAAVVQGWTFSIKLRLQPCTLVLLFNISTGQDKQRIPCTAAMQTVSGKFMRQLQILLIVLILLSSNSRAQVNHDSTFLLQLKTIDSYIFSIDTFKLAVKSKLVGNLDLGAFEGSCLHDESIFLIYKIHLDFDTSTSKTIYFKDNKPIKIIDNKSEFYNLKKWFDKNGSGVEPSLIAKLLLLAEQCLNNVRIVLY